MTQTAREKIEAIVNDNASSDLIRFVCAKMLQRDPVDAANELAYVAELFEQLVADLS